VKRLWQALGLLPAILVGLCVIAAVATFALWLWLTEDLFDR
jgi:hypothetical protein